MDSPLRVWIDDRHPIFRRGLAACLAADGFEIAGESVGTAPTPDRERMDVLVFEATAAAVREIANHDSTVSLIAIVTHDQLDLVATAVNGGVGGVLIRSELDPASLVHTINSAVNGHTTLPTAMMDGLLERVSRNGQGDVRSLTDREMAVLQMLADGEDTRSIAEELAYSERTVKKIVRDLLVKLNSRNRTHAVATAARQGLI